MNKKESNIIHDTDKTIELHGVFSGSPLFESKDKHFYIRKFHINSCDNYALLNTDVIVSGYLPNVSSNIPWIIRGNWQFKEKYDDWQIKVVSDEEDQKIMSRSEVLALLSSPLFIGIGKKTAESIYEYYKERALQVVENSPEEMIGAIKGMTARKVNILKEGYVRNKYLKFLIEELYTKGISQNICEKIYEEYGDQSLKVIKEKPYSLAYDISGIGFKTADRIALTYNSTSYHSLDRIKAGVYFALKTKCESTGDEYAYINELETNTKAILNTRENESIVFNEVLEAIKGLYEDKRIVIREGQCYLTSIYNAEVNATRKVVELIQAKQNYEFKDEEIEEEIEVFQESNNVELSDEQKFAVKNALSNSVFILTGGPGVGKSFTLKAITDIYQNLYRKHYKDTFDHLIETCAPTGKAAKRVTEATGIESKTIHALLEVDGITKRFKRNETNPLNTGMVVVDETSMVDLRLFSSLLSAVTPSTTRLILVGDPDQLPSVGIGNVLHDLLEDNKYVPSTKLTRIYRQDESSNIVRNAYAINNYKKNDTHIAFTTDGDFDGYLLDNKSVESTFEKILEVYKKCCNEYADVQVLTPVRKETRLISSTQLNPRLSVLSNPDNQEGECITKGETTVFHKDDKVIQLKNNYKKGVLNGEIGVIKQIKEGVVTVEFDREKEVDYVSVEELDLAYAMTTHKSQGSEFDCVIIPVVDQDMYMLNRQLIYTAITRAKKKVVLLFSKRALSKSIFTKASKRKTNLAEDIRIYYNTKKLPNYIRLSEIDKNHLENLNQFSSKEEFLSL